MVIRRLRQNVGAFHRFIRAVADYFHISPAAAAARVMGRWPSGSPVVATPTADAERFNDPQLENAFAFHSATAVAGADPDGALCPFGAHIRKMNPRDTVASDGSSLPNPIDTQSHRLLRRGFPYGSPSSSTFDNPVVDEEDRGLLFVSYQTSIENQFEFVIRRWANEPNFPEPSGGFDVLIGQNNSVMSRRRMFRLSNAPEDWIATESEWVIPTGGGYFFAPSTSALGRLASTSNRREEFPKYFVQNS
jgi:Dyp-type peroxidase family